MKRSKHLSRGPAVDANGRRRFSTFAPPSKGMTRTPMKRKPARRLKRRAALSPLLAFIRRQDCFSCGRRGPSDAAHMTLDRNSKGIGLKVPDDQAVPLCGGPRGCHRAWDTHAGRFAGRSDEERYTLASSWVDTMRMAVIPESYDSALLLQAAGLGTVVTSEGTDWWWLPAGTEEEERAA